MVFNTSIMFILPWPGIITLVSLVFAIVGVYHLLFNPAEEDKNGVSTAGKGVAFLIIAGLLITGSGYYEDIFKVQAEQPIIIQNVTTPTEPTQVQPICGNKVCESGETTTNCPNDCLVAGTGEAFTIERLSVILTEKGSGKNTQVNGTLKVYDANVNPSNPNSVTKESITITQGSGLSTNGSIRVNSEYRVVFDGGGKFYDEDFGVITFPSNKYNPSTATFTFDPSNEIMFIATIDDVLNPIVDNTSTGRVNGETATSTEYWLTGSSDDVIYYNYTAGSGTTYLDLKPSISQSVRAYAYIKDFVMCFYFPATSYPEGNEYTSILFQYQSGVTVWGNGAIPNEIVEYWKTPQCVLLASEASRGDSGIIRLTFTPTNANFDTSDEWFLYFDDLGATSETWGSGRDVISPNRGSTGYDQLKFDAVP